MTGKRLRGIMVRGSLPEQPETRMGAAPHLDTESHAMGKTVFRTSIAPLLAIQLTTVATSPPCLSLYGPPTGRQCFLRWDLGRSLRVIPVAEFIDP
jgi:hypothetical protein